MTEQGKTDIRKMLTALQRIENGEKFFFNITLYTKMGLVFSRNIWAENAVGKRVIIGHTWHLTPKAKKFLNVII